MPCPRCKGLNIVLAGTYKIKRSNVSRQRFRCLKCKKSFTLRNNSFHKKIGLDKRKKIIELYKTKKYHVNKFDNLKKNTYSTRDIANFLDVSKSFVHKVIQEKRSLI